MKQRPLIFAAIGMLLAIVGYWAFSSRSAEREKGGEKVAPPTRSELGQGALASGTATSTPEHRSGAIPARTGTAPRHTEAPDVVQLDEQYPGAKFYEQFRSGVEQNAPIRKSLRRCMAELPESTTEVFCKRVLTFVKKGNLYKLQDVSMDYDGVGVDKYMDCARNAYLENDPSFVLPGAPDTLRVKTTGRFYVGPTTNEAVSEHIAKLHGELSRNTDADIQPILEQTIEFWECVERRGVEHKRECYLQ